MEFAISEEGRLIEEQVVRFINEKVIPAELTYADQIHSVASGDDPPIMKSLRADAKRLGLWNLFLPDPEWGPGVSNHDYSVLCEHMGRSQIASRAFNCQAPDTGNIEILAEFGTPAQKEKYLKPLLEGEIRSCFSMTEPDVSGADPTGLRTLAVRDGDEWVINGHKWFTSGAIGAKFAIAMVVTNPHGAPHERASMILVPTDAPGFNIVRAVPVMGHTGWRRALRDPVSQLPRAGRESARAAARRLHARAGTTRSRPHSSLHARDRHGGTRVRDHVPTCE